MFGGRWAGKLEMADFGAIAAWVRAVHQIDARAHRVARGQQLLFPIPDAPSPLNSRLQLIQTLGLTQS